LFSTGSDGTAGREELRKRKTSVENQTKRRQDNIRELRLIKINTNGSVFLL
jgi:hypothetical protein